MSQTAGAYLAKGSYTCVYAPPVPCAEAGKPAYETDPNVVSRIMPAGKSELPIQIAIRRKVETLPEWASIQKHFNLFKDSCTPRMRPEDVANAYGDSCDIHQALQSPGEKPGFTNMITPKYDLDFFTAILTGAFSLAEICTMFAELLRAIALTEGGFVHVDSHFGNVGVVRPAGAPAYLVLDDWGFAVITDMTNPDPLANVNYRTSKFPAYRGRSFLEFELLASRLPQHALVAEEYNALLVLQRDPRYTKQWLYCVNFLALLGAFQSALPRMRNPPPFLADTLTATVDVCLGTIRTRAIRDITNPTPHYTACNAIVEALSQFATLEGGKFVRPVPELRRPRGARRRRITKRAARVHNGRK